MIAHSTDAIAAFSAAIYDAGLTAPESIISDGQLHRFASTGKGGDDAGWYVLHAGEIPAGIFGCWRAGFSHKWSAVRPEKLSKSDAQKLRAKWRAIQRQHKAEREKRHAEAAEIAGKAWQATQPATTEHPYLAAKGVGAYGVHVDEDGLLLVPMRNGALHSLQFIGGEGEKRFLPGGRVAGCYHSIGTLGDILYLCEGYATGASIHEATGSAVGVAFTAGNLKPVAESMREKYPDTEIVLAADNDIRSDGTENTGVTKATEAAKAINGRLAVPELDGRKCDFNDVHRERGLDAVRRCLDGCRGSRATADGEGLLNEVREFISRFCVFPDTHCLHAVTLWAAHAHIVEHLHVTPRLSLLSPEAGSGKTRVLDVLELLVPDPEYSLSASPASIFRLLAAGRITLLFDEVDAIWSRKGKDDSNEDLRALLNAGYKLGAQIPRCVGPQHEVVRFPVYCAVALAGLGDLPDTIMTRSVIIRMRRRAPHEPVSEFRTRKHAGAGHAIRDKLAVWSAKVGASVGSAWPELPEGIVDRPAEIWEPLVALADAAGGHWPQTARAACVELCRAAEDRRASLGVRLLGDLRTIFGNSDALYTKTILDRLTDGDDLEPDAPWNDLRGKPLGERGLASMLRKYEIRSKDVREPGGPQKKGYSRGDLWDAWQRYLPSVVPAQARQARQARQHNENSGLSVAPTNNHPRQARQASNDAASSVADVAERSGQARHVSNGKQRDVADVADMREEERRDHAAQPRNTHGEREVFEI